MLAPGAAEISESRAAASARAPAGDLPCGAHGSVNVGKIRKAGLCKGPLLPPTAAVNRAAFGNENEGLAMLVKLLFIALGGAIGASGRWLVSGWAQRLAPSGAFPVGTLVVNALGCLLMGLMMALFLAPGGARVREEHRLAILVGALGGFTTFSTYAYESLALAEDGAFARAGVNVLASNILGLASVWIGYRVGRQLLGV